MESIGTMLHNQACLLTIDTREPSWKEVSDAASKARSTLAPGPNGIPMSAAFVKKGQATGKPQTGMKTAILRQATDWNMVSEFDRWLRLQTLTVDGRHGRHGTSL